jgi:hypothetical protein
MAGGGDLGFYIGSYTSDANATAFLTGRGYTQARGYIYWDSVTSQLKVWDGSAWGVVTGAGAVSPWTESPAGMIYPIDYSTDDVAVGTNAMLGTERFRVVGNTIFSGQVGINQSSISAVGYVEGLDDDESATRNVFKARLVKDAAGAKTAYGGFVSTANINDGSVGNLYHIGGVLITAGGDVTGVAAGCYFSVEVGSGDTVAIGRGVWLADTTGSGTITTAYGIDIEDQGLSSTTTYGIYIADQSGTTAYGIYQAGTDDKNVLMGQVGINQTTFAGTNYVEVLDNEESATRYGFVSTLEKNAAGAKTGYLGFSSGGSVDAGSVSAIQHFKATTTTAGGSVTSANGYYATAAVGSGDTVETHRGLWLFDATGSGTITTAYGIRINDQGLNSTTTYGIYIADQSGTTAYGIYQVGTDDKNVLMGQVGINQTTFAGTNYVEVLDNEESSSRYCFVAKIEKDAAGAKSAHVGFQSVGSVDAGSVTSLRHMEGSTRTSGGDIDAAYGFYYGTNIGSGDTVTTNYGIELGDASGSGTVTTAYGIRINDQGLNSTTTYGIYIADQSGTTAYGVYQAGSGDFNFFDGTTGFGINPSSVATPEYAKLYVQKTETADLPSDTRVGLNIVIYYDPSSTGYNIYDYRAINIRISNLSTDTSCDIDNAYGVYVNSPVAEGGDIERAIAFYCEDMTADADVLGGWGVYLNGSTTRNYMAGVLGAKNATPSNSYAIDAGDDINTSGVYLVGGTAGVSGSFTTSDSKTVTVTGGIITNIV